ncbi:MAG: TM0106 family RecB-like putative nuclease [Chloroflexia bacterium]|nr:TM0106 family RecB-like putative nuclease [Chloroflexia bacterium]
MDIHASDVYAYYHPSPCELRVFLRHQNLVPEADAGPYQQWLSQRGRAHEIAHRNTLPNVHDLGSISPADKVNETLRAIRGRAATIYQGRLEVDIDLGGPCHVIGEPDFLILMGDGYGIRDSKSIKELGTSGHPDVRAQLQIYGWLYEQVIGKEPVALEVHCGTGQIESLPFDRQAAVDEIGRLVSLRSATQQPYSPLGWSKCSACGFFAHCWPEAETGKDVALLPSVQQWLARALRDSGVRSYEDLLNQYGQESLAGFSGHDGRRQKHVSEDRARKILQEARAFVSGQEIVLSKPTLPDSSNYVMLDLEGLPPQFGEEEWVFLWGLQVFGDHPSDYLAAFALDRTEEQAAWEEFLAITGDLFEEYGADLPFVHWHHYERVKLQHYISRFGDIDGVAAQVADNLCDLLPITKKSFVLPLPSYSLKVVEEYLGFRRSCPGLHGDWAMAQYVALPGIANKARRDQVIAEICTYNREDLEATWHVFSWLMKQ